MDKSKVAKLCNEIEDIVCDISQQTMNEIISAESRMIFDKAKEIAAEITAPPKSNADLIRQMTDEELAEWLDLHGECNQCAYHPAQCKTECNEGHLKWLKQDENSDDESGNDTDNNS
jgi:hypothetical protein